MGEVYDIDILEWSVRQGDLLRNIADGHPANERPDWANIIEEIESVGRSQLDAVESLLTLAFLHDLKCLAWPGSRNLGHWQAEARLFRRQAMRKLTPSMRGKIDVASLFNDALAGVPPDMDGVRPSPLPTRYDGTLAMALEGPVPGTA